MAVWTHKTNRSSQMLTLWTTRIKWRRTNQLNSTKSCNESIMHAHQTWSHWSEICSSTILSSGQQQRNASRAQSLTKSECQLWSAMLLIRLWQTSTRFCLLTTTLDALETRRRAQRWLRRSSTTSRSRSWKRSTCWESCTKRIEKTEKQSIIGETWCFFTHFDIYTFTFFVWQPNLSRWFVIFVSIEHTILSNTHPRLILIWAKFLSLYIEILVRVL